MRVVEWNEPVGHAGVNDGAKKNGALVRDGGEAVRCQPAHRVGRAGTAKCKSRMPQELNRNLGGWLSAHQ